MQKRRRFTKEFKRETVQMVRGADLSIQQVITDLGIHAKVVSQTKGVF